MNDSLPIALVDLIAYAKEKGLTGRYQTKRRGAGWWASVQIGNTVHSGPAATRAEALERAAGAARKYLGKPTPGTPEYQAWLKRG